MRLSGAHAGCPGSVLTHPLGRGLPQARRGRGLLVTGGCSSRLSTGEPLGSRAAGSGPPWSHSGFTAGHPHTSHRPGEDGQQAFWGSGHGTAGVGAAHDWQVGIVGRGASASARAPRRGGVCELHDETVHEIAAPAPQVVASVTPSAPHRVPASSPGPRGCPQALERSFPSSLLHAAVTC